MVPLATRDGYRFSLAPSSPQDSVVDHEEDSCPIREVPEVYPSLEAEFSCFLIIVLFCFIQRLE